MPFAHRMAQTAASVPHLWGKAKTDKNENKPTQGSESITVQPGPEGRLTNLINTCGNRARHWVRPPYDNQRARRLVDHGLLLTKFITVLVHSIPGVKRIAAQRMKLSIPAGLSSLATPREFRFRHSKHQPVDRRSHRRCRSHTQG